MVQYFLTLRFFICSSLLFILLCGVGDTAMAQGKAMSDRVEIPDSIAQLPPRERLKALEDEVGRFLNLDAVKTVQYGREVERLAKELNEEESLLYIWQQLAHSLLWIGMQEEALDLSYKGKELAEKRQDTTNLVHLMYVESAIYNQTGDHEESIRISLETERLETERGDQANIAWAENSTGESYRYAGMLDKAEEKYASAHERMKNAGIEFGLIVFINNLGLVAKENGDTERARMLTDSVFSMYPSTPIKAAFLESALCRAEVDLKAGEPEPALALLDSAKREAQASGMVVYGEQISVLLVDIYRSIGDYERALEEIDAGNELRRSIDNSKVEARIAWQEGLLETEQLQSANALLVERESGQRKLSYGLAGVLLSLLVIVFLVIRNNRRTKQLNNLLQDQNFRLDELNREKDSLMQIVAHDLKAPLTNVEALGSMMGQVGELNEMQENIIGKMDKTLVKGKELIENLLELAQLENEAHELKLEDIDLADTLRKTIDHHAQHADQKSIQLEVEIPDDGVNVTSNGGYYERLVDNILSNAIKYSPKERRVWISLEQKGAILHTTIRDEGPGISPEDQAKMFRKFQKLSARPTAGESSTGLGLAIVKQLAEQLAAEIQVESKLGEGTAFIVTMPQRHPELS